MGCTDIPLPEPLLRNHEVNCLVSNGHDEPYNDSLYLFRAIANHLFDGKRLNVEDNTTLNLEPTKNFPLKKSFLENYNQEGVDCIASRE